MVKFALLRRVQRSAHEAQNLCGILALAAKDSGVGDARLDEDKILLGHQPKKSTPEVSMMTYTLLGHDARLQGPRCREVKICPSIELFTECST